MADRRALQPLHHRDLRRLSPFQIFLQQSQSNFGLGRESFDPNMRTKLSELIHSHICLNDQSVSQIPCEDEADQNHQHPAPREESPWRSATGLHIEFFDDDEEGTTILEPDGDYTPTLRYDGFSEDTISDHLQTRTHHDSGNEEAAICVVCQCEYEENENLGSLRCGHEYHSDCIRRWLLLRKFCPVCKRTA